ncbi:hypothetical protein HY486_00580 [Candidatus Woesearchaeota archaeon]|nr:hypothetical protein [Candidatus Woesearchaeota archaeon]
MEVSEYCWRATPKGQQHTSAEELESVVREAVERHGKRWKTACVVVTGMNGTKAVYVKTPLEFIANRINFWRVYSRTAVFGLVPANPEDLKSRTEGSANNTAEEEDLSNWFYHQRGYGFGD